MEVAVAREKGPKTIFKRNSCFEITDGVPILTFEPSVENFLSIMEAISELCGETKEESFGTSEIEQFKSMIVFVSEWKQFYFCDWMPFHYKSKTINFTYLTESVEAKNSINGIMLPHFSSAAIPKVEKLSNSTSAFDNDDFILHVGGSIWSLDWCPRLYENIGCDVKCEYLAIAAHPIGSEYHKIGELLSGRGFIQIWCFLHLGDKEELLNPGGVHHEGKGNKKVVGDPSVPKKRRGRPRKIAPSIANAISGARNIEVIDPSDSLPSPVSNGNARSFFSGLRGHESTVPSKQSIVPLSDKLSVLPFSGVSKASKESAVTEKAIEANSQLVFNDGGCAMKSCLTNRKRKVRDGAIIVYDDNDQAATTKGISPIREDQDLESIFHGHVDDYQEIVSVTDNSARNQSFIPEGIALPRLVLSLAHNGKVAWDMKWRPFDAADSTGKHRLGYLAVLLGNGSLEVWEVPVHGLVKTLYASCQTEGIDPRFLKLQPVFRCSRMKSGERQSIPLTLEWSPSASRDLILVGCHDGMVALWKFCSQLSSQDTRPLLCFTADTVPIRSLAWAPNDSDVECSSLIVTAGHEGLKFWDLRSPYRPLMDLCLVQRAVLGLDWLKDPRCIVIAYEDGILRTLSLTKIANDVPVTGEQLTTTKQQGLHSQSCSFFAIWSVQVSRSTGLVAYCSSDGCTRYFQLTAAAVDKDSSRYRRPHFLCGSLAEEGPTLIINTPLTSLSSNDHATNYNSSQRKSKGNPSTCAKAGQGALQDNEIKGDTSTKNIVRFPSKILAMHKVRWNMNRGSGRWLCYGGASGIVRCQAISPR